MQASEVQSHEAKENSDYLKPAYWDKRFEHEDSYEWLRSYADIQQLLAEHLCRADRILIVGNGTSALPLDMAADGYCHLTATDLSHVAVARMLQREQEQGMPRQPTVTWQVADMLALPFADGSFDAVIEKAAIDVFLTDCASPWHPTQEAQLRVHTMLAEVHRVLTPTGLLVSITFAQPHFRRPLLLAHDFDWGLQHTPFSVDEGMHYHLYAMRKGTRGPLDLPVQLESYNPEKFAVSGGTMHSHMDSEDFLNCIDV